jgi:uncharacterized protein (DUF433 family)
MAVIVTDEEIRSGDPRIEGTRITVLDVKRRVIDGDEDPFAVAAEYDLDVAAVFEALAYYYENADAMGEREATAERRRQQRRLDSDRLRARLASQDGESELESP